MSTTNTTAAAPKGPRFKLLFKLNSGDNAKLVYVFLRNDLLKHEIEKLKLEEGTNFESLFTVLAKNWEGAPTLLAHAASTPHLTTKESTVVRIVAHRLRRAVEKHTAAHPQEVKNERIFNQHLVAAGGVVVEAVYEIGTGQDGAFAPALFGTKSEELAAKITQKKRPSEKDLKAKIHFLEELCFEKNGKIAEFNFIQKEACEAKEAEIAELSAMHKETYNVKDAEIASLKQQLSDTNTAHEETCKRYIADFAQLKASQKVNGQYANEWYLAGSLSHYKKNLFDAELANTKLKQELGGMNELRAKLERATLSEESARSALGDLREDLEEEKKRFESMRHRLNNKVKDLENQIEAEEARAKSALKDIDSMPDDD